MWIFFNEEIVGLKLVMKQKTHSTCVIIDELEFENGRQHLLFLKDVCFSQISNLNSIKNPNILCVFAMRI